MTRLESFFFLIYKELAASAAKGYVVDGHEAVSQESCFSFRRDHFTRSALLRGPSPIFYGRPESRSVAFPFLESRDPFLGGWKPFLGVD